MVHLRKFWLEIFYKWLTVYKDDIMHNKDQERFVMARYDLLN